jgi:glycerophosphoryl diester phosphodiesterase
MWLFIFFVFCLSGSNVYGCEIIAHRGASSEAPENTLASFNLAWKQNADIVEFDIHLTRDQEIVVIHDESTKRTGDIKLNIAETDYKDLLSVDVGSSFGPEFAGEKIPTLAQVLATVPDGKRVAIEIKCHGNIVKRLAEEIEKSGLAPDQILIISFEYDEIVEFKRLNPQFEVCMLQTMRRNLITRRWKTSAEDILEQVCDGALDGCVVKSVSAIDAEFVETIQSAGYKFRLYTVDDLDEAENLMRLGVDGIATNCPAKMLELRSKIQ